MLIINAYGRLGADPVRRQSKSGKDMATASIVVDVSAYNATEPGSQWFNLLCFGAAAESLLRGSKGDMLAVIGRASRGSYTAKDGEVREQWSLIADSVVGPKNAKPTGKARPQGQADRWA